MTHLRFPWRMALLAMAVSLAGCAQVKETMYDAKRGIERAFSGGSTAPVKAKSKAATRMYESAVAARAEGRESAAFAKFGKAADRGHPEAQYQVAQSYANGRGVARNLASAARWYGKAAVQGVRDAQYSYGAAHVSALGVRRSRVAGYGWLVLAARAGHGEADVLRRAVAKKMKPGAIKKAERWANRFEVRSSRKFADRPTVAYVQQVLNEMGYDAGPVDGQSGRRTRGAITKFQKASGLSRNGQISPTLVDRLLKDQESDS